MQIIAHAKKDLAFGLNWKGYDIRSSAQLAKRTREVSSAEGIANGVVINAGNKCALGYAPDELEGKAYSAASGLAAIYKDGIFIGEIDQDVYWYCHVENGVVAPAGDFLGDWSSVKGQLNDWIGFSNKQIPIYCPENFDIDDSAEFHFKDNIDQIAKAAQPIVNLSQHYKRLATIQLFKSIGTASAVISVLGGLYWYQSRNDISPSYSIDPGQSWVQTNDLAEQVFFDNLAQYVAKRPVNNWVDEVVLKSGLLHGEYQGWKIESISCFVDDDFCTAKYINTLYGTNRNLDGAYGDLYPVTYSHDGNGAVILFPLDSKAKNYYLSRSDLSSAYKSIPEKNTYFIDAISGIQKVRMTKAVSYATDETVEKSRFQPTIFNSSDQLPKQYVAKEYQSNSFTLSGNYLALLQPVLEYVDNKSYYGSKLTITFNQDSMAKWILEGFYVYR